MLLLRYNTLSSGDLITVERTLIKFRNGKIKIGLDFNVWDYSLPELLGIVLGMFVRARVNKTLGVQKSELLDFILSVENGYYHNYYHSFLHAVDVVCVIYYMLYELKASELLPRSYVAALLIAGLCHDLGHPGLNNMYQINAGTELAKLFGTASVLEKYSIFMTMELCDKHRLLRNLRPERQEIPKRSPGGDEEEPMTREQFRATIENAILATDMAFHYDLLSQLNFMVESLNPPSDTQATGSEQELEQEEDEEEQEQGLANHPAPGVAVEALEAMDTTLENHRSCSGSGLTSTNDHCLEAEGGNCEERGGLAVGDLYGVLDDEQCQQLCNIILHAADISNTVRPWELCKRWSDLVVEEFFRQGDLEKAQGLPVSPQMNRDISDQQQISLKFGDFIVKPYFEAIADLFPESRIFMQTLSRNRMLWQNLETSTGPPKRVEELQHDKAGPEGENESDRNNKGLYPGRRVSFAAGTVVITDDALELNSISGLRRRRKYGPAVRSASHGLLTLSQLNRVRQVDQNRRHSDRGVPPISSPDDSETEDDPMLLSPHQFLHRHPRDSFREEGSCSNIRRSQSIDEGAFDAMADDHGESLFEINKHVSWSPELLQKAMGAISKIPPPSPLDDVHPSPTSPVAAPFQEEATSSVLTDKT
ncbi:uncharacterized protein VTP21DRAFT_5190 [Calcarisporiella thermophila]|uniref:uncharacterized protein n=1 Tax=Calcarisporiella thermophila TaxID=911321 RepID=UPI0037444CAF